MKPHQDCQITEPPPPRMEEVIVHTSYFRPHIMTTDDLGLADLLERLEDSQKACFDAGLHIAAMDIQSARAAISALRSPRAVPANGAGREAIAETLWRAEYRRATGKERSVEWFDGVEDDDKNRYRFLADAILALASSPVVGPSTLPRPHRAGGEA